MENQHDKVFAKQTSDHQSQAGSAPACSPLPEGEVYCVNANRNMKLVSSQTEEMQDDSHLHSIHLDLELLEPEGSE